MALERCDQQLSVTANGQAFGQWLKRQIMAPKPDRRAIVGIDRNNLPLGMGPSTRLKLNDGRNSIGGHGQRENLEFVRVI